MSEVISSEFEIWVTGVCSPYVVSLCDFAYFGMLCLFAISMMFVKILLAVCTLVIMVV